MIFGDGRWGVFLLFHRLFLFHSMDFNQISEEIARDSGSFRRGHGIVGTGA